MLERRVDIYLVAAIKPVREGMMIEQNAAELGIVRRATCHRTNQ